MSQYDTGKVKSEQKYMYFIMLLIWYMCLIYSCTGHNTTHFVEEPNIINTTPSCMCMHWLLEGKPADEQICTVVAVDLTESSGIELVVVLVS